MRKTSFKRGDIVYLKQLNACGEVVEVLSNSQYLIHLGNLTIKQNYNQLEIAKPKERQSYINVIKKPQTKQERNLKHYYQEREFRLDLHSFTTAQALSAIDQIIEEAKLNKAHKAYIIHGKGTGTLRNLVQNTLRQYHSTGKIKRFEYAPLNRGGHGVTIVYL